MVKAPTTFPLPSVEVVPGLTEPAEAVNETGEYARELVTALRISVAPVSPFVQTSQVLSWALTMTCRVSPTVIPEVPSGADALTVTELSVLVCVHVEPSSPSARACRPAGSSSKERMRTKCSSQACRVRRRMTSRKGILWIKREFVGGGGYRIHVCSGSYV